MPATGGQSRARQPVVLVLHDGRPVLADDDLATAKRIGISVLGAVLAFTAPDDPDALTLLRVLRDEVLCPG
ncbi:hypothetical protein [Streptomyces sp. NBC_01477]|uniref:hypothetical protein n=1 Tax=Streptomyces sp. NBC_01477 TaxID=2976015 RepID=UPI002E30E13A|nr:hypothetical protein [Streptomyces sp. NBC_01477]